MAARAALASASALVLSDAAPAFAHGFAGDRFFPATIATDDPAVADELSLPTLTHFDNETDVSGEWSKRITPQLGFSVAGAWTSTDADGQTKEGFQNIETTLKWQFLTSAAHETILAAGLSAEWGGTGAKGVGAEATTTLTPTLYFGKGLGDLPRSADALRPFAVTGLIGYTIPTEAHDASGEPLPYAITGGLSVQYSLPYLTSHIRDHGWPRWANQLTPLVELTFESPVRNGGGAGTTGTVNPGVIWTGRHLQLGLEAVVPLNHESGDDVGWTMQTHVFIDDLLPHSVGRPLFGGRR
jgi:hypothetical protein